MAALIVALLVTAVAVVTGLVDYVPQSSVPVTGWVISSRVLLLVTVFVLVALVYAGYKLYRNYEDAITEQWKRLSIWHRRPSPAGAVVQ